MLLLWLWRWWRGQPADEQLVPNPSQILIGPKRWRSLAGPVRTRSLRGPKRRRVL